MRLKNGWEYTLKIQSPIKATKDFYGNRYEVITVWEFIRAFIEDIFPDLYYRRKQRENLKRYKEAQERYKSLGFRSMAFRSFFDQTTNTTIWNSDQIKERERAGEVMMTHEEAKSYASKKKKEHETARKTKSRSSMSKELRKIIKKARETGEIK